MSFGAKPGHSRIYYQRLHYTCLTNPDYPRATLQSSKAALTACCTAFDHLRLHVFLGWMKIMKKFSLCLTLFTVSLLVTIPAAGSCDCTNEAVTGIPQVECEALIAFHMAAEGPYWAYKNGWRTTSWIGNWFGLTVENGHVTGIDVSRNWVKGTLSPRIAELTNLYSLNIGDNAIGGNIPTELGEMNNLHYLLCRSANFTGSIPPELGNMENLRELNLYGNRLSGNIPPEIGNLANLQALSLEWNELEGRIPPEIGNLVNLQDLSLSRNELEESIPPELGNMINLEDCNLSDNYLSGEIPPELGDMTSLESLSLGENQLSGSIPPELGDMTGLKGLYLEENRLSGSIPPELGGLANLISLQLQGNQLEGSIPPELGGLANLISLRLQGNQLEGSIPPELGKLTALEWLYLQRNRLTGSIPAELGNLQNLEYLTLSENLLEGAIPAGLNSMDSLLILNLGFNQLEGMAPGFGNFEQLGTLRLNDNKFTAIPPEIGNLTHLLILDLSRNQMKGQIPPEIGNLTRLWELLLQGNQLSGPVPDEIMNLQYLNTTSTWGFTYEANADYNKLYTDDPAIEAFMNEEFAGWNLTQTLPPENIEAEVLDYLPPAEQIPGESGIQGSNMVRFTWDPIAYREDDGGYQLCIKESAEGDCITEAGITADKAASSLLVSGLNPDTEYFFELETRTYPHVINLSEVTSRAEGVFSVQTGNTVVTTIPFWNLQKGTFTGMAFSNYGIENTGLSLAAWDETGLKQSVPVNPSIFDVPTGQQVARLGTEFFGVTPDIAEKISWVEVTSDHAVGSFFTFGSSDIKMLDGAVTQSRPSSRLWFTRPLASGVLSEQGETALVNIALVNPLDDPVDVKLFLIQAGETVDEAQRTVASKGFLYSSAVELFDAGPLPVDAYMQVETTAGAGLIGFSRVDFPATRTTLALNAAEPASAETFYSAQLASGPGVAGSGMETHIRLVNPMEGDREGIFKAVAENGTLLAETVTRTLAGRSVSEFKAWELFAFEGDAAVGSLVIAVDSGGVVGDVIFTPFAGIEYATAMPLQTRPVTEAVFNHIANSDEIYTGLAFFNPTEEYAQIMVVAKRGDGTVAGTRLLLLAPGHRISRTLNDPDMLPGTASQLDGFISISSTQPIICQQLFGAADLRFLAAVPPTTSYTAMF